MGWFTKSSSSSSSSGEWIKIYLCSHVVGNRWLETIAKLCLEQLTSTSDLTWPKIRKKSLTANGAKTYFDFIHSRTQ